MREDGPASPSLHDELRGKMSADNEAKDGRRTEVGDDRDEGKKSVRLLNVGLTERRVFEEGSNER